MSIKNDSIKLKKIFEAEEQFSGASEDEAKKRKVDARKVIDDKVQALQAKRETPYNVCPGCGADFQDEDAGNQIQVSINREVTKTMNYDPQYEDWNEDYEDDEYEDINSIACETCGNELDNGEDVDVNL